MANKMNWTNKEVMVTGGASFIGSHLADDLVKLGAKVTVLDNLSGGKKENLSESLDKINFINKDLEYSKLNDLLKHFEGIDLVFHLAAVHGGRGYIDTHPADICSNLAIDHHVYEAAYRAGVEKVVFASSACVYPPKLQKDYDSDYLLREEDCTISDLSKPLSADLEYGWAKLMGEIQLNAYIRQYGLKGCSLRFVTAYGPRENETHAIIALIYKSFEKMNPYVIWGTGEQSRDFTYVTDIVKGCILAAEKVDDGTSINLGTGRRFKLKAVANEIFDLMGFSPKIEYDTSKPTGVVSRALDTNRAKRLLGWKPDVSLEDGLQKAIDWYVKTHGRKGFVDQKILMERS